MLGGTPGLRRPRRPLPCLPPPRTSPQTPAPSASRRERLRATPSTSISNTLPRPQGELNVTVPLPPQGHRITTRGFASILAGEAVSISPPGLRAVNMICVTPSATTPRPKVTSRITTELEVLRIPMNPDAHRPVTPNARINRARRTVITNEVSRMKAALFALRLNELLGAAHGRRLSIS